MGFFAGISLAKTTSEAEAAKLKLKKKQKPKKHLMQNLMTGRKCRTKIAELVKKKPKKRIKHHATSRRKLCIWCLRFNNFMQTTPELKNLVDENYIYYHSIILRKIKREDFCTIRKSWRNMAILFLVLDKKWKANSYTRKRFVGRRKRLQLRKVKHSFEALKPKNNKKELDFSTLFI